jgi:hypothetical protein
MSAAPAPSWLQKVNAIRDAFAWATRVHGDWKYKKEAFSLPDDNAAWFELSMGRMLELGVDEIRNEDNIDPVTEEPYPDKPRAELVCGQRQFFVEVRAKSRDQEQDAVAWLVLDRARARMRMRHVRDSFLRAVDVNIVEMLQVIPMPAPRKPVALRWQSEALLEIDFTTVINERDDAAVGTWIETIEISSQLRNPGGVLLDPSLQLDNEVMP